MVLTASHQTTGRQALQHTTDAHDRETARRPLGVWLGREKILRTPTGVLKGAENGTGFWTHVEQLRTFLGAQSGVLLAQHEPQRCPDTRSHNETGASTLHLQVCAPQRGSRAETGRGVGSLAPWQHALLLPAPPASVTQKCSARARAEQAAEQVGAGAAPSACQPAHGLVVCNLQRSYSCRSR